MRTPSKRIKEKNTNKIAKIRVALKKQQLQKALLLMLTKSQRFSFKAFPSFPHTTYPLTQLQQ